MNFKMELIKELKQASQFIKNKTGKCTPEHQEEPLIYLPASEEIILFFYINIQVAKRIYSAKVPIVEMKYNSKVIHQQLIEHFTKKTCDLPPEIVIEIDCGLILEVEIDNQPKIISISKEMARFTQIIKQIEQDINRAVNYLLLKLDTDNLQNSQLDKPNYFIIRANVHLTLPNSNHCYQFNYPLTETIDPKECLKQISMILNSNTSIGNVTLEFGITYPGNSASPPHHPQQNCFVPICIKNTTPINLDSTTPEENTRVSSLTELTELNKDNIPGSASSDSGLSTNSCPDYPTPIRSESSPPTDSLSLSSNRHSTFAVIPMGVDSRIDSTEPVFKPSQPESSPSL